MDGEQHSTLESSYLLNLPSAEAKRKEASAHVCPVVAKRLLSRIVQFTRLNTVHIHTHMATTSSTRTSLCAVVFLLLSLTQAFYIPGMLVELGAEKVR